MSDLTDALTKLAHYRSRYADGDVVDVFSGLTAADLDVIIALTPALHLDVQGVSIDASRRSAGMK